MTRVPEPPDFPASQLFLRRLAYSLVRDPARAEDLVQDTWAAWVEHRPSGVAEPRAWLARVLRNRAFNQKRGDRRRAEREELAGRPDPSMPETEGTLEAQAQLLEALRKLEEPYRSTLVERYYHDLAPSEIAGRSGTPLNTVKARLLRGLEKLRAEMDRRYGGDRGAWCHWLGLTGPALAPLARPPAEDGGAAQSVPPFAGLGGSGGMPLVGWLALAGVIAVGAVLRSEWGREPRTQRDTADERQASVPGREAIEGGASRRARVPSEEPAQPRARPAARPPARPALEPVSVAEPASTAPAGPPARAPFEWPQYGGGADHNGYREREDAIRSPKLLWFFPGCSGQPTLSGGDLYTAGGPGILRLDADTGAATALALDAAETVIGGEIVDDDAHQRLLDELEQLDERARRELAERFRGEEMFRADASSWIASAPIVTRARVFVRWASDGSVSALDRELDEEAWRWPSDWDAREESPATKVPLCLTGDELVLVALHDELVALRASDGLEQWRRPVDGVIRMVPAESGGRVFFGTDRGQFVALWAGTGQWIWQTRAGGFGSSAPMVVDGRVYVAERSGGQPRQTHPSVDKLRVWTHGGDPLWDAPLSGDGETVGLGVDLLSRSLVTYQAWAVKRYGLASGKEAALPARFRVEGLPLGTPAVVGKSLVLAEDGGRLSVHDLRDECRDEDRLRWAVRLPRSAEVQDFVATGDRLYVATSVGLFCLADDPGRVRPAGYVLKLNLDTDEPWFAGEDARAGK